MLVRYRIFSACVDLDTFAIDMTSHSFVKSHEHVTSRAIRRLTDIWYTVSRMYRYQKVYTYVRTSTSTSTREEDTISKAYIC